MNVFRKFSFEVKAFNAGVDAARIYNNVRESLPFLMVSAFIRGFKR